MPLTQDGTAVRGRPRIDCDLLAVSGGWSPDRASVRAIGRQAAVRRGRRRSCRAIARRQQRRRPAPRKAPSGSAGRWRRGSRPDPPPPRARASATTGPAAQAEDEGQNRTYRCGWCRGAEPLGRGPKQFVDLQNDVTASDIELAAREGYQSIEHVKRYTATGLRHRPGQARQRQRHGDPRAGARQRSRDRAPRRSAPTTRRSRFGAIAGRDLGDLLDPIRKTADRTSGTRSTGAVFENVGQWKRPGTSPSPARPCTARSTAKSWRRATRSASWTRRRSARSTSRVRTPSSSSNWVYTNAWYKLAVGARPLRPHARTRTAW